MDIFVIGFQTSFASVLGVLFSVLCMFSVRSFFMLIGVDKANTFINYLLLVSVLSFFCTAFDWKYFADILDTSISLVFIGVVLFQLISVKRIWQEYILSPLIVKTIYWCLSVWLVSLFAALSLSALLLLGKGISAYRWVGVLMLLGVFSFSFSFGDVYLKAKGKWAYK